MSLVVREEDVAYGLRLALSKKEQKKFIEIMKKQRDFFDFFVRMGRATKKDRERYDKFKMCYFFFLGALFSANKMRFPTINNEDIKRTTEKNLDKIGQAIQRLKQEIEECEAEIIGIKGRQKLREKEDRGDQKNKRWEINNLNPIFEVFISSLLPNANSINGIAACDVYLLADIFLQKAELEETMDDEKRRIIEEAENILKEGE